MLRLLLAVFSFPPFLKSLGSLIYLGLYFLLHKTEVRHREAKLILTVGGKLPHQVNFFRLENDRKNLLVNINAAIILTNLIQDVLLFLFFFVLNIQNFLLIVLA